MSFSLPGRRILRRRIKFRHQEMANDILEEIRPVELDWFADGDVVSVTPRNQERFEIQKDRAIQVLQMAREAEQFQRQFNLLLKRLAEWIRSQRADIDKAFVTLQDGTLAFVVVRKEAAYDEDFQDALADVDIEVANDRDLDLITLKTLALPNISSESLRSFLDERLVLSYHGE